MRSQTKGQLKGIMKIELKATEILILSNLYLSKDYPYCFITRGQLSDKLGLCRDTVDKLCERLMFKGFLRRVKSYITTYQPTNSPQLRQYILEKIGVLES